MHLIFNNRFAFLLVGWMVLIWGGPASATHIMGGEITWQCLDGGPNAGKYVFRMKIYRDCNGVALNGNQTLTVYGAGAPVSQITMVKQGQSDVSPVCTPYTGAPIITCAGAGGNTPGAVEEHIYQSAPITLAGVPPLTGWVFTWDLCCRNALVANIVNPANYGHTLRAIMYPYIDPATGLPKNTSPCFDSSPKFEESARVVICTGYEYSYSNNASDYDLDSIYYDWAQPLDDGNNWPANPLPFVAPYSYTNPVPSATPIILDNVSGRLTLTPNAGGGYVMCIKAETWKCGQKVAEIFRDIQQVFLTNCGDNDPPVFSAVNNTPGAVPIVNAGNNLYTTTVMPGQMVEFMLQASDTNTGSAPAPSTQLVTFEANGGQLGIPMNNPNGGCNMPPCATIVPAPGQTGFVQAVNNNILFHWDVDCSHLSKPGCGSNVRTFTFNLKMYDDFCPAPAISIAVLQVNVINLPAYPPTLQCIQPAGNGGVTLSWQPPVDTGFAFNYYVVYHKPSGAQGFLPVDTVYGYQTSSVTLQGPNAFDGSYAVATHANCDVLSGLSDTLNVVQLSLSSLPPTNAPTAVLNWTPLTPQGGVTYEVWAEAPPGSGQFTSLGTTTDTLFSYNPDPCLGPVQYHVSAARVGINCLSYSDSAQAVFQDNSLPGAPLATCINRVGGMISLQWLLPADTGFAYHGTVIYGASQLAGPYLPLDTVGGALNTSALVSSMGPNGGYYFFRVLSNCNALSANSDTLTPIDLSLVQPGGMAKTAELSWNSPFAHGFGGESYEVIAEIPLGSGNLVVKTGIQALQWIDSLKFCNDYVRYWVRTDLLNTGCYSHSDSAQALYNDLVNEDLTILDSVSINMAGQTLLSWQAATIQDASHYLIWKLNTKNGTWNQTDSIPWGATMPVVVQGSQALLEAETYKVISVDSCGNQVDLLAVDEHTSIFITATIDRCEGSMLVNWSPYEGFSVDRYEVWASSSAGGAFPPPAKLADVPSGQLSYVIPNLQDGLTYKVCIRAKAIGGLASSTSNPTSVKAELYKPLELFYLSRVDVTEGGIKVEGVVDGESDGDYFKIERSTSRQGPWTQVAQVGKQGLPPYAISFTDLAANPDKGSYFYRLAAIDSCASGDTLSNHGRNILLKGAAGSEVTNYLSWNSYENWLGGVANYRVFRQVDFNQPWEEIAVLPPTDTTYEDKALEAGSQDGIFHYWVMATEGQNPLGIRDASGQPLTSTSNTIEINYGPRVYIPGAIVPNSQIGENSIFKPSNLFAQPGSYQMIIYNRWGEVVFETRQLDEGWNGYFKGQMAPMGTYVYAIAFTAREGYPQVLRGHFVLVP